MDFLYFRYILCTEVGFIVSLLGIIISVVVSFMCSDSKKKALPKTILGFTTLLLLVFTLNYIDVRYIQQIEYIEMCNLVGMNYDSALEITRQQKLNLQYDAPAGSDNSGRVVSQRPAAGTKVLSGTYITVSLSSHTTDVASSSHHFPRTGDEPKPVPFYPDVIEADTPDKSLSIQVMDLNYFHDGYYYTYTLPNDNSEYFIDFSGKGVFGDIQWEPQLSESEIRGLSHGGRLVDQNGRTITEIDGDYASFFLTADQTSAHIACEFPKNLPKGQYTYVLVVIVNDVVYEYSIPVECT